MSTNEIRLHKASKYLTDKLGHQEVDEPLLSEIINYLANGPSSSDSAKVACSDTSELNYIRDHFLIGHIGATVAHAELDKAIKNVCEELGSSNRNKLREIFYYLLINNLQLRAQFMQDTIESDNSSTTEEHQENDSTEGRLTAIIKKHARYAAIVGLAPFPLLDIAAIGAIQHNMIDKIAHEFPQVKSHPSFSRIITSLIGGFSSVELGLITKTVLKGVPIIGTIVGGVSTSAYAYYSTKVVGEIFQEHFTSGGDLSIDHITFDKMKEQYRKAIRSMNLSTS